jgi:hypothetical protein
MLVGVLTYKTYQTHASKCKVYIITDVVISACLRVFQLNLPFPYRNRVTVHIHVFPFQHKVLFVSRHIAGAQNFYIKHNSGNLMQSID